MSSRRSPDVVHVDSRPWLQARASGTTPASLIGAVRRGRRLRIEYDSHASHAHATSSLIPTGCSAKAGIWYLVADCARVPRDVPTPTDHDVERVDQPRLIRENQTLPPSLQRSLISGNTTTR